jgi:hypothetical protein
MELKIISETAVTPTVVVAIDSNAPKSGSALDTHDCV